MSTSVRVPMPLSSDEIKVGIAKKMAAQFEQEVLRSLGKTCSLNHASFSKFSARWKVEYHLDDFGRATHGSIGGFIGDPLIQGEKIEGAIEEMPPDKFRRETTQAIPAAQTVTPKKPEDAPGMTRSGKGRYARKTT